jgi:hypothetical protein
MMVQFPAGMGDEGFEASDGQQGLRPCDRGWRSVTPLSTDQYRTIAVSVPAEPSGIYRLQLVEVGVNDRRELVRESRAFEVLRQVLQPRQ